MNSTTQPGPRAPRSKSDRATFVAIGILSAILLVILLLAIAGKQAPASNPAEPVPLGIWAGAIILQLPYLIGGAIGLAIYFLPTIVAARSNHPHAPAIILVNVLLGWTLLGWVGALVWIMLATARPVAPPRI